MKKRRYAGKFKKEMAKMIIIDGTSVKEVSQQLGVPEGVLKNWKLWACDLREMSCEWTKHRIAESKNSIGEKAFKTITYIQPGIALGRRISGVG